MGVRISVFAPYFCNTLVSGLDEYADGCLFGNGADWYPFCLGGGTGRGVLGVGGPSGVSTPKSKRVVQKSKKHPPATPLKIYVLQFCMQPPPPRWNFPTGTTGAGGAGAGGAGAGGAGAEGSGNAGKVSAGIPDHSSEGFLTTHRKAS